MPTDLAAIGEEQEALQDKLITEEQNISKVLESKLERLHALFKNKTQLTDKKQEFEKITGLYISKSQWRQIVESIQTQASDENLQKIIANILRGK